MTFAQPPIDDLTAPPDDLATTRRAVHQVQYHVLTQARFDVTGRIGLRWTPGGCGTPPFGDGHVLRIDRDGLHVEGGGAARSQPLTTLGDVRTAAGLDPDAPAWDQTIRVHDTVARADLDAPLAIDADALEWLGSWYGFGWALLERLRADEGSEDPSQPQLWPEHQDPAIEVGSDGRRRRASVGFSPGDDAIEQPYAYVSAWYADDLPDSPLWNATTFTGAVLPVGDLLGGHDHHELVWSWLVERRDALQGR